MGENTSLPLSASDGSRCFLSWSQSLPQSSYEFSHGLLLPFLSLIRTFSLDLGLTLILYGLIWILTLIISTKTLFTNKVTFWGSRQTLIWGGGTVQPTAVPSYPMDFRRCLTDIVQLENTKSWLMCFLLFRIVASKWGHILKTLLFHFGKQRLETSVLYLVDVNHYM